MLFQVHILYWNQTNLSDPLHQYKSGAMKELPQTTSLPVLLSLKLEKNDSFL